MSRVNRWRAWDQMIKRCYDPDHTSYKDYGARGITVDPRWLVFEVYYFDTGEPPKPDMSLDRIDNDGPYSPDNWRWATRQQQAANRRSSTMLTFMGRTQCVSDWARERNLKVETVIWRLKNGWSIPRALLTKNAYK